jgi:hypothetical protein
VIEEYRKQYLDISNDLLPHVIFSACDSAKRKVMRYVLELEPMCAGSLNYSCWYKDVAAMEQLSVLLGEGRASILSGDLVAPAMLQTLRRTIDYLVSVFNMSNAIEYIDDTEKLEAFFVGLNAADGAKVVTSSQWDGLS